MLNTSKKWGSFVQLRQLFGVVVSKAGLLSGHRWCPGGPCGGTRLEEAAVGTEVHVAVTARRSAWLLECLPTGEEGLQASSMLSWKFPAAQRDEKFLRVQWASTISRGCLNFESLSPYVQLRTWKRVEYWPNLSFKRTQSFTRILMLSN